MKKTVLIAAAALLAAVFLFSCQEAHPSENAVKNENETVKKDPSDCLRATYFLGDSNTAHLAHEGYAAIFGMVEPTHIFTGSQNTLMLDFDMHVQNPESHDVVSVSEAVAKARPEYLIITLGYNGYANANEPKKASLDRLFHMSYKALINDIKSASPKTEIIIQSIFPVTKGDGVSDPDGTNRRIDELNAMLKALSKECNLRYLDTNSALKDPATNCLRDEYSKSGAFYHSDGYHLSDKGLLAVLNYIKENAYE